MPTPENQEWKKLHRKIETVQKNISFNLKNFAEATDQILHELQDDEEDIKKQEQADDEDV